MYVVSRKPVKNELLRSLALQDVYCTIEPCKPFYCLFGISNRETKRGTNNW